MDKSKRDKLLKKVGDVNNKQDGLVLVSLEEFFEGNDDAGSIWCNLPSAPSPQEVYKILKEIRGQEDVSDIKILVTQWDGAEEWPFSDSIYFLTSLDPEQISSLLGDQYSPDEISIRPSFSPAKEIPLPEGMNIVYAWWD